MIIKTIFSTIILDIIVGLILFLNYSKIKNEMLLYRKKVKTFTVINNMNQYCYLLLFITYLINIAILFIIIFSNKL